ncbi:MAG TPA: VCBS repeat-containing protein, partial [Acidobacteriaceae bacterium]
LADVNGDGFADLIYTVPANPLSPYPSGTSAPNVYVQYSNGASFGPPVMVATDSSATVRVCSSTCTNYLAQASVNAVGDVNGDHHPDILFADGSVANLSNPFTVFPKYFIGSVIYIPPGQGSSVTYGAGTVTGSTVSTTDSWKFSASVDTSLTFGGNGGSITFGGDFGGQTMHSVDMQNTLNQSALYKGSPPDLINHDFDFIQIFLGVQVNAAADYLHNVSWGPDFSHIAAQNFAEQGYYINVGCLRSSTTIPASVCTDQVNFLSSVGIIPADYPSILGADPFADPNASPTPDPNRYVLIDSVGYLAEGTPIVNTYNESNSSTVTNSQTTSYSYTLSASFSSKVDPFAVKESNTFTWSHSSTNSNKTGSTSTSAFALASPSATYSGPTVLKVYIDTIYKTFMFSFN